MLARALRLVLVTPGDRAPEATLSMARAALGGGVTALLVREPQLAPAERAALLDALVPVARAAGAAVLVHRDAELAQACGADAVHTGHGGRDVGALREAAPGLAVGRSAHWPLVAQDLAADYVLLSPFRPTPRSHPRPLLTGEQVRAALEACAAPGGPAVVALGGLGPADVPALPDGLAGVAVMRAVADAPDPRAAARALSDALAARYPAAAGAR